MRLIDVDKLEHFRIKDTDGREWVLLPVKSPYDIPPVDAAPVVHAEWIHDINNLYGCSACLERETMSHKKMKRFCPNCGSKMGKPSP